MIRNSARAGVSRAAALWVAVGIGLTALSGCQTTSQGAHAVGRTDPSSVTEVSFTSAETDPDRLRQMDPPKVLELIGQPNFQRKEQRVTVWQYHETDCVMDLFWYQGESGPELMHYEARSETLSHSSEAKTCFTQLLTKTARERTS
ncbi:MAG: hypothetical protein NXI19_18310 [Alphaproteobacteria bacterium]|nr:hypothetical protein [Alphaproteobacteria bacterium]